MAKLTSVESRQLKSLEARVEVALEAASAATKRAPQELCDILIDALSRLRSLDSGSEERPDAVESIERALAALEAWHRWQPPAQPTA